MALTEQLNNCNQLINCQQQRPISPPLANIFDLLNGECSDGCIRISLEQSVQLGPNFTHAAHCFLFAGSSDHVESMFGLMQMRTDGRLGFTGGGVEEICPSVSQIVAALNREILEEINYDCANVNLKHYVMSHLHLKPMRDGKRLITHFFIKKVSSMDEFRRIEENHTKAAYFPSESLGIFRVPIYPQEARFLDFFSKHFFAGNAREQLFEALDAIRNGNDHDWE